ncbi:thiolase [Algiphilus sp.]|uniref:thiolase n=1 Tax=Algiphilus sp. TaxID=1872431 RepID=UPI003C3C36FA
MEGFPSGRTAIVGAATFGIGKAPGLDAMDLATHASLRALDDAGLALSDVDALFITQPQDTLAGMSFADYLGVRPRITDCNRSGGSSFMLQLAHAALALDAGYCDVALIAYGSNQATASGKLVQTSRNAFWDAQYKPLRPVSAYALAAARHMHEYGTTKAQLAEVAVAARGWAQSNPDACRREPLTIDEVVGARMISDPLGKLDCCLVTDGAAAIVMTRADRARDCAKTPVYALAAASAVTHGEISSMPDLTVTGATESGARAYAQAGLRPDDIDVVQVYDAFTINTILFLEDLGFCPKGEGGRFVENGAIAPGGRLAVNTSGGGLSYCHPGMFGLFTLVESIRQLRGECGARQVPGAGTALAHGNGGLLSSQATVILGNAPTHS